MPHLMMSKKKTKLLTTEHVEALISLRELIIAHFFLLKFCVVEHCITETFTQFLLSTTMTTQHYLIPHTCRGINWHYHNSFV